MQVWVFGRRLTAALVKIVITWTWKAENPAGGSRTVRDVLGTLGLPARPPERRDFPSPQPARRHVNPPRRRHDRTKPALAAGKHERAVRKR
jgi:hypothetical protein